MQPKTVVTILHAHMFVASLMAKYLPAIAVECQVTHMPRRYTNGPVDT